MKKALLIASAALLALAAIGSVAYGARHASAKTKTRTRAFAQPIHEIVVRAHVGDIELVSSSGSVTVRERLHYLIRKPTIHESVVDGVLTLETSCNGLGWVECGTDFRIAVPAKVALRLETNAGDIKSDALAATDIRVRTNAGDVRLDLVRKPSRVDAHSNAGDVHVSVPRGTYAVDTATDIGDENVDGLVVDDRASRTIDVGTNVGDVTVDAR